MINNLRPVAFAIRSQDYLECAKLLISSQEQRSLKIATDDPIDLLVGHAFELAQKARLMSEQEVCKRPESFSHRILELFDFLTSQTDVFKGVSQQIAVLWRQKLLAHRNRMTTKFPDSIEIMELFDFPSEDDIATLHYSLRNDVSWYNDQITRGGNLFRYYQSRYDVLPTIRYGSSVFNRPRQSLIWATELLLIPIPK